MSVLADTEPATLAPSALARAFARAQLDAGRAQDVAGVAQGREHAAEQFVALAVVEPAHLLHHLADVGLGEQRLVVGVAAAAVLVVALGVHLGQRGGVLEHDAQQVGGGHVGPDRALVAARHQHRQAAAVVDVGVAEHHRRQPLDVEGKRLEVAVLVLDAALDHAAVEQQPVAGGLDLVAGAGDFAGGAVETYSHALPSRVGWPMYPRNDDGRASPAVAWCLPCSDYLRAASSSLSRFGAG